MECEQIAQLLPDYLQGDLRPDQQHDVEAHLKQCADCAEEIVLWEKLFLLPIEQPSPASRARFEAMLQAYRADRSTEPRGNSPWRERFSSWNSFGWLHAPLSRVAWSAALLAIGFISGLSLANSRSRSQDLAALESQLASMKQMVVLSMLQQQSAGARLEGVTWSTRDQQLDPKVLSALLHLAVPFPMELPPPSGFPLELHDSYRDLPVEGQETIQKSFSMAGVQHRSLEIDNVWGSIEVLGTASDEARLTVSKSIRAASKDKLEQARKEVTLDISEQEGFLKLYVNGPFRCHCDDGCGHREFDGYIGKME